MIKIYEKLKKSHNITNKNQKVLYTRINEVYEKLKILQNKPKKVKPSKVKK